MVTALIAVLLLTGCVGSRADLLREAEKIAQASGLSALVLRSGDFWVLGFERPGESRGLLVVYIEGDGRAWTTPWQPSSDPTPTDPIGLRMAAADPFRPLLYLARPCQFVVAKSCRTALWTSDRLSPAVVAAYHRLIDDAQTRTHSDRLGLVGYSGGGTLAGLIAEERHDVAWLITVGANLDLGAWVQLHSVDRLSGSLDPTVRIRSIERLPQTHFVGAEDSVVPATVVESFMARLPTDAPARLIVVPGFDHSCCWAEAWPQLLKRSDLRP
jgi:hypothetical protein